jgi:hypothetical protein
VVQADKSHQTGKADRRRWSSSCAVCPVGGIMLDPFAASGTTLRGGAQDRAAGGRGRDGPRDHGKRRPTLRQALRIKAVSDTGAAGKDAATRKPGGLGDALLRAAGDVVDATTDDLPRGVLRDLQDERA